MVRPESVGLSSNRLARVRPGIEKHIGAEMIEGAMTLLARRSESMHRECFGLADREQPVKPDTLRGVRTHRRHGDAPVHGHRGQRASLGAASPGDGGRPMRRALGL